MLAGFWAYGRQNDGVFLQPDAIHLPPGAVQPKERSRNRRNTIAEQECRQVLGAHNTFGGLAKKLLQKVSANPMWQKTIEVPA